MRLHHLPNLLTLARIGLTVPTVWLLVQGHYGAALLLFAVAGISDGLDGLLAKRYGWSTPLGSILDPLADKILLVSAYLVLGLQGYLPLWLVVAVIGRDVIIVAGVMALYYVVGRYAMAPSMLSKVNTTLQITLVLLVVVSLSLGPLPDWLIQGAIYAVLISTVSSGVDYVWRWSRRAAAHQQGGGG